MAKRKGNRKSDIVYFNFPIQMVKGLMKDPFEVLSNIAKYGMYSHTLKLKHGNPVDRWFTTLAYYNLTYEDKHKAFEEAKNVYHDFHDEHRFKNPMVGINKDILMDYLNKQSNEFEMVCLLGFLALKSIIGNKPFCKITNNFWVSRMDGRTSSINTQGKWNFSGISYELQKFCNEYQLRKIKNELQDNWGLVAYSRFTRGFYVTFKIDKESLMLEAEKRRKSTKEKQRKLEEKIILQRVLNKLNNES